MTMEDVIARYRLDAEQATLYWLHDATCSDPSTDGYVGITKGTRRRGGDHRRSRRFPSGFIMSELLTGCRADCLFQEFMLRPARNIGWNVKVGGGRLAKFLQEDDR